MAETDLMGRSLKAQMKYAGKMNFNYVAVIGEEELSTGSVKLRNMKDGTEEDIRITDLQDKMF